MAKDQTLNNLASWKSGETYLMQKKQTRQSNNISRYEHWCGIFPLVEGAVLQSEGGSPQPFS